MTIKRITYGDMIRLLELEGFAPMQVKAGHTVFQKGSASASLALPLQKPKAAASDLDLELLRRTMIDFGIMNENQFERWIMDPKQFQAA